jgi:hypothetical protein
VFHFSIALFSGLLALFPVAKDIQQAWLRNSAVELHEVFTKATALNISLPEPILFSDQVSNEQAYFLFERIFSTYKTFEFIPEARLSTSPEWRGLILKARWSFRNTRNNSPYLFEVFFYLIPDPGPPGSRDRLGAPHWPWKISEIKAEKL